MDAHGDSDDAINEIDIGLLPGEEETAQKVWLAIRKYEGFFIDYPKPFSVDILGFLEEVEWLISSETGWLRPWLEYAAEPTDHPVSVALSDSLFERFLLNHNWADRYWKLRLEARRERQEGNTGQGQGPSPALDSLYDRLRLFEIKLMARYAERVIGIRRVAGLIKVLGELDCLIDHELEENPETVRAEIDSQIEIYWPITARCQKRLWYIEKELPAILKLNRNSLRQDADEVARSVNVEEARRIFAEAYGLQGLEEYVEVFPTENAP